MDHLRIIKCSFPVFFFYWIDGPFSDAAMFLSSYVDLSLIKGIVSDEFKP